MKDFDFFCYLFSIGIDSLVSYYFLSPFLTNGLLKEFRKEFQSCIAAFLVVLAFGFLLNLVSVVLQVFGYVRILLAYILDYDITLEVSDSMNENQLP
ncbi:hypothetical protein SOMG_04737 [Schizosaccharomyces osmophilus]|uniref:Uncharacterized protein n=1 Tax=Schizosaccharomyces osmophilus TaxID=2545709 RepID=A0AAF0B007_9SCHI|nr:uncharacterized protein SOMG_04737 [Schizosaccharomyces osmophilus]WBW75529.1 hypothetical protein SOMG_04737 [Schizosaccharomyces osmophilus]